MRTLAQQKVPTHVYVGAEAGMDLHKRPDSPQAFWIAIAAALVFCAVFVAGAAILTVQETITLASADFGSARVSERFASEEAKIYGVAKESSSWQD